MRTWVCEKKGLRALQVDREGRCEHCGDQHAAPGFTEDHKQAPPIFPPDFGDMGRRK